MAINQDNYVEIPNGTILKATDLGGSNSAISIVGGTVEPFEKLFQNGITVKDSGTTINNAVITTNLIVSGSMVYDNVYSRTGTTATITTSDFGTATVLLIGPGIGQTITVELPAESGVTNSPFGAGKAKLYIIKKTSTLGTVTINPAGSYTIDGATSVSATAQYSYIQVIYSGNTSNDYLIIANNGFS